MTRKQKIILDIVQMDAVHLTAYEIWKKAQAIAPSISLSTTYRNLGQLVELGLIKKIEIDERHTVYDRNISNHAHLICDSDSSITDICSEELERYLNQLVGHKITAYNLVIHYDQKEDNKEKQNEKVSL